MTVVVKFGSSLVVGKRGRVRHGVLRARGREIRRIVRQGRVDSEPGLEFEGNVFARGLEARRDWYVFYQELIRLRLSHPALTQGDFRLADVGEACAPAERSVVAFERSLSGVTLLCGVNLGPEPRVLKNADAFRGKLLYGGLAESRLGPFQAVVVQR